MSDGRDDVTDRVASRFGSDDEDDDTSETSENDMNAQSSSKASSSQSVTNVKNAWKAKTVYLPDSLHDELGTAYKRLDLDLDNDFEELRKTRHFYPLLVAAGLERMESMERKEVISELENIDPDLGEYLSE